jgi:hypothetical protein
MAANGAILAIASSPTTPNAWPPRVVPPPIAASIPDMRSRASAEAHPIGTGIEGYARIMWVTRCTTAVRYPAGAQAPVEQRASVCFTCLSRFFPDARQDCPTASVRVSWGRHFQKKNPPGREAQAGDSFRSTQDLGLSASRHSHLDKVHRDPIADDGKAAVALAPPCFRRDCTYHCARRRLEHLILVPVVRHG